MIIEFLTQVSLCSPDCPRTCPRWPSSCFSFSDAGITGMPGYSKSFANTHVINSVTISISWDTVFQKMGRYTFKVWCYLQCPTLFSHDPKQYHKSELLLLLQRPTIFATIKKQTTSWVPHPFLQAYLNSAHPWLFYLYYIKVLSFRKRDT